MDCVSLKAFNEICQPLMDDEDYVVWVRSPDYQKQIFISQSYRNLWGRDPDLLYKDSQAWSKTLLSDYRGEWMPMLLARVPGARHVLAHYIIHTPNGENKFIQDRCYFLADGSNKCVAIAGICKSIPEMQWQKQLASKRMINSSEIDDFSQRLIKGVNLNEHNPTQLMENNFQFPVHLSKREIETLYYMLQGKSAKETAQILNISYRTVEIYIAGIKKKMGCQRKFEIQQKIPYEELKKFMVSAGNILS